MQFKIFISLTALAFSTLAIAQDGTKFTGVSVPETQSRSEVLAELALWRQAGLGHEYGEIGESSSREYPAKLAEYTRLRSGPQYIVELQRQERGTARAGVGAAHGS